VWKSLSPLCRMPVRREWCWLRVGKCVPRLYPASFPMTNQGPLFTTLTNKGGKPYAEAHGGPFGGPFPKPGNQGPSRKHGRSSPIGRLRRNNGFKGAAGLGFEDNRLLFQAFPLNIVFFGDQKTIFSTGSHWFKLTILFYPIILPCAPALRMVYGQANTTHFFTCKRYGKMLLFERPRSWNEEGGHRGLH